MKWHDMTIGLLGGCPPAQKEIGLNNLFYRCLSARLKSEAACRARFRFGQYAGIEDAVQKYLAMAGKTDIDVLVFIVRPQPFLAMTKPLIKYADAEGGTRFSFHPALFRRTAEWDGVFDERLQTGDQVPRPLFQRISLAPVNLAAGKLLRLDRWACETMADFLLHLNRVCERHGTQLFIVGPPAFPASLISHLNCMKLNRRLRDLAHVHSLNLVDWLTDTDKSGQYLFMDDGIQLNADGHRYLAEKIFTVFKNRLPLGFVSPAKHPVAA
jgi:hypothetical protein